MKKWEEYFREILGGVDGKVIWEERERERKRGSRKRKKMWKGWKLGEC